ncbi:MAG: glycoside hydrolase family 66 protein, partial [Acidimicrobiia bacterium]
APEPLEDATVLVKTHHPIARAWWIDPDGLSAQPQTVEWSNVDSSAVVRVPKLSYWGMVLYELATEALP